MIEPPATPPSPTSHAHELDLRHLRCPLPVLRTRRHLSRMAPGESVRVLCTDPLAGLDIPHLVRETGDVLVGYTEHGETKAFVILKRDRTGSL